MKALTVAASLLWSVLIASGYWSASVGISLLIPWANNEFVMGLSAWLTMSLLFIVVEIQCRW